jgi:hypothetical protein
MIKIKLECWWADTNSINNRLIKQFVSNDDLNKFEFVNHNPDYTIIFGKTNWDFIQTPKEKTFYFSQEPLWSPNQPHDNIHNYCSKIFISDKREYPNRPEYIELLLPMFYAGRGETDNREEYDWSKKLINKSYAKTKDLSFIVTKNYSSHFNQYENLLTNKIIYQQRTDFAVALSQNLKVDIYGTYWDSNGNNIKGDIFNKHIGLDEYRFSIACENTIQKNYISEKFWDLILTDTIPIYLGCNNIKDLIPENSFIYLNELNMDEMVETINKIMENPIELYDKYINNVKLLKQEFFKNKNYNLWEKIKSIIDE